MSTSIHAFRLTTASAKNPIVAGSKRRTIINMLSLCLELAFSPKRRAGDSLDVTPSVVAASGTVTCASAAAADTVTVAGQAFTAINGGTPTSIQWDMSGGTDALDAVALRDAVNNHATIGLLVHATAALGVVTFTAKVPGVVGNQITLASSNGSRLAVAGTSGGKLSGGTEGTSETHTF